MNGNTYYIGNGMPARFVANQDFTIRKKQKRAIKSLTGQIITILANLYITNGDPNAFSDDVKDAVLGRMGKFSAEYEQEAGLAGTKYCEKLNALLVLLDDPANRKIYKESYLNKAIPFLWGIQPEENWTNYNLKKNADADLQGSFNSLSGALKCNIADENAPCYIDIFAMLDSVISVSPNGSFKIVAGTTKDSTIWDAMKEYSSVLKKHPHFAQNYSYLNPEDEQTL